MAETRREILMRGFDPLALLGVNDENLKVLEDHFNAEIMARGQSIKIVGDPIEVERIHHILNQLIQLIPKKEYIKPSDVKTVINIEADDSDSIYSVPEESIILFTPNGLIRPRTAGQAEYYRTASENDITFAIGPAGTGKTYQAVAMAVAALKNREIRKIILTRPAVEAGENLGFLPGDMKEKIDPYLAPLYDALKTMISPEKLKVFFEQKIIEIVPLAYMRGRTLDSAFLILDEAQNTTPLQMKMFLTRIGVNSKAIITGDITQIDLPSKQRSGLMDAVSILKDIDGIGFTYLTEVDVVRHHLVKRIIKAYSDSGDDLE
ncbi:MAG: Phosphate starvation-inducible protein PhoH-like protein [Marinimicrobia bacterium 46_47]|nr:MAG: Phosphate starvation-inducible protein PhoH-like protein [Marinimicrobia bacterium 46_47]KUK93571.1 MAG: Phosphate starvation-inducible protein PhoH-like protein [Marinimicrobia bacterium 46_43]